MSLLHWLSVARRDRTLLDPVLQRARSGDYAEHSSEWAAVQLDAALLEHRGTRGHAFGASELLVPVELAEFQRAAADMPADYRACFDDVGDSPTDPHIDRHGFVRVLRTSHVPGRARQHAELIRRVQRATNGIVLHQNHPVATHHTVPTIAGDSDDH